MTAPTITIDGFVLNDTFRISDISRNGPEVEPVLVSVPGRPGQVCIGEEIGVPEVSFRIWSFARDSATRRAEISAFNERVMRGSHELTFSDEPGTIRDVRLKGKLDYDEYERRTSVELTFVMENPYRRATPRLIQFASAQTSFTLLHANPDIVIDASNVKRRASDNLWQLTFDNDQDLQVEIPSPIAAVMHIDCVEGVVTVDGARCNIINDSEWPTLAAGNHTVQVTAGSSATTLTIIERLV